MHPFLHTDVTPRFPSSKGALHLYLCIMADTFIRSDLHCIQGAQLHLISSCFPGDLKPMTLVVLASCFTG